MSRSSNRTSDYFLETTENKGPSLFPSGLLMYDLPSLRRTASRIPNNVEIITQPTLPSPVPSVGLKESLEIKK
jgi:hypothetical protein